MESLVNAIKSLKCGSAPGDDEISNEMIKNYPSRTINILHRVFILCIRIGHFPRPWKRAKIKMIAKPKKDASLSSNYRPISLLSNVGKLMEKLVKKTIDRADIKHNIISDLHSGFRRGRSTQESMVILAEEVSKARKCKQVVASVAIDVDKAFDRLNHSIVKYRIKNLPLPAKTKRIISSFLNDRILYVQEGETKSREVVMRAGSPQGAIGSPDIFILNSFDTPIDNDEADEGGNQFADDLNAYAVAPTAREAVSILKRRLAIIEDWSTCWSLIPSAEKSTIICFTGSKRERQIAEEMNVELLGKKIEWNSEMKILGVKYDSGMKWEAHLKDLVNSAQFKVLAIAKMNRKIKFSNRALIMQIFESLVISIFKYSCVAFINMPEKNWNRLESFYCRWLKIIFDLPLHMSNETARRLFSASSLRNQLEHFAVKRFADMSKNVKSIQNLIFDYGKYAFRNGKDSLIDRIFRITQIEKNLDCYFCPTGV